ncbi:MAG: hypothetical protein KC635_30015, partial [Myxococcales bacterium]|nr:hypothetical protein [Myxococcales bacterium]
RERREREPTPSADGGVWDHHRRIGLAATDPSPKRDSAAPRPGLGLRQPSRYMFNMLNVTTGAPR